MNNQRLSMNPNLHRQAKKMFMLNKQTEGGGSSYQGMCDPIRKGWRVKDKLPKPSILITRIVELLDQA